MGVKTNPRQDVSGGIATDPMASSTPGDLEPVVQRPMATSLRQVLGSEDEEGDG
jgi:hypothetical protein